MMKATEEGVTAVLQSISTERKVCVRLPMKKSFSDLPTEELVLSVHYWNAFTRSGINTIVRLVYNYIEEGNRGK